MARETISQTPTRRSRRNQPTATPSTQLNHKNILECAWTGEPIHVRKTNPELDSLPNELGELPENKDDAEDVEEIETVFYAEFRMKRKATSYRGAKGMQISKAEMQVYRVGTPVMVETDALSLTKRPPSIGIIISMWQTRVKGEEVAEDPSKMCVRIHWFVRPNEMANHRAEREHEENEVYYTLSLKEVITPGAILSRCVVSGIPNRIIKEKQQSKKPAYTSLSDTRSKPPATPSKRGRVPDSPLKKTTRFSPASDDDDSNSDGEEGKPNQLATNPEKNFYCRNAVDSRRGIFYELSWERHRADSLLHSKPPSVASESSSKVVDSTMWGRGLFWDVLSKPSKGAKGKEKKQDPSGEISESEADDSDEYEGDETDEDDEDGLDPDEQSESDGNASDDGDEDDPDNPRTPRKRKCNQQQTPRKRSRKTVVQPTPHSKVVLARRRKRSGTHGDDDAPNTSPRKRKSMIFAIRNPEQSLTFQASMAHLPKDLWLRSMHALHVGSRPDVLPCREEEYARVLRCVGELLEEGSGGCVYISGVPGTGKTATVHSVVKELKRMAQNSEANPFTFVEINGLKIPEPSAAYSVLWEGISGHDVAKEGHLRASAKESLKALTRHFTTGNRGPGGHACVVLMDELDQLVTSKQDVVYNFFNWPTLVNSRLVVIAVANTMDLPERVMTGRVRSRLGMIRINFQPYTREQLERIVEARLRSARESLDGEEEEDKVVIAPDAIKLASMTVSRITGDARRVLDICRRAVELVKSAKRTVKAPHVLEVVQIMQNTPTAGYLRDLSFHERLMLASLVKCVKREGVEEIKWGDVQHQHLIYMDTLPSEDDARRKPTPAELVMVLDSLVASRAVVVEYGVAVARKHPDERRLFLNIEQGEVEKVLGDVGGVKWKNVLGN